MLNLCMATSVNRLRYLVKRLQGCDNVTRASLRNAELMHGKKYRSFAFLVKRFARLRQHYMCIDEKC